MEAALLQRQGVGVESQIRLEIPRQAKGVSNFARMSPVSPQLQDGSQEAWNSDLPLPVTSLPSGGHQSCLTLLKIFSGSPLPSA